MKRMFLACLISSSIVSMASLSPAWSKNSLVARSKYPTDVQPLSRSNEYVRRNAAPDFWALMPFLTSQTTNSACSVAAATLILNGARRNQKLGNNDPLLTTDAVLEKTDDSYWTRATQEDGGGIAIDDFERVFRKALRAYGFARARVQRVSIGSDLDHGLENLLADLAKNETSDENYIVLNFDQGAVMEDESVGHFAVVGAFDKITGRVLILDSDKEWYEPYWVPASKLLRAMQETRGYIKVKLQPGPNNIDNAFPNQAAGRKTSSQL